WPYSPQYNYYTPSGSVATVSVGDIINENVAYDSWICSVCYLTGVVDYTSTTGYYMTWYLGFTFCWFISESGYSCVTFIWSGYYAQNIVEAFQVAGKVQQISQFNPVSFAEENFVAATTGYSGSTLYAGGYFYIFQLSQAGSTSYSYTCPWNLGFCNVNTNQIWQSSAGWMGQPGYTQVYHVNSKYDYNWV